MPRAADLDLPVRAVQFGTGVFLRGFVEALLDDARRAGTFAGRVVAVGSTGSGRDGTVNEQDGLFTLLVRGLVDGVAVNDRRVVASLAGAIAAQGGWRQALALAREPDLEVVFSNTTEVGIAFDPHDRLDLDPPRSFPGKLTAFLSERATAFACAKERGLVVLPCELVEQNGDRLREIVLQLAALWALPHDVVGWIRDAVFFCNTLVDRIVTGTPADAEEIAAEAGYRDALVTECEPYRLFAIEASGAVRDRLAFVKGLDGVVVSDDIAPYRERKVRLLNGAHTVLAPLALLAGIDTVREAVTNPAIRTFVRHAMLDEIAPTLDVPDAQAYARQVLERFDNPFIRHQLVSITLQGTMKMRVRIVPSIVAFAKGAGRAPASLSFGFAAWVLYMRGDIQTRRASAGLPVPADDGGEAVRLRWRALREGSFSNVHALVDDLCADRSLWGTDLTSVPGLVEAVSASIDRLTHSGINAALAAHLAAFAAPA